MSSFSLEDLAKTVSARAGSVDSSSYTAQLARKGVAACARKLGEETVETVIAAVSGDYDAVRNEAADVIYHLLVLLHVCGVPLEDVKSELGRRTAQTGLQEKAARDGAA